MEIKSKLNHSKTYRAGKYHYFDGIYVMAVEPDDTTARIRVDLWCDSGSAGATTKLDAVALRGLAADLLTAAAYIEDNAAQRAVSDLTNTDAQ